MGGFDRQRPFNDLPPLPPRGVELETKAVLKRAIGANKALAELKGAGDLIPNQSLLIQSIVLQEAKLSSEIENVVTTNDKLYRALSGDEEKYDPHTKEVLRYGHALWRGYVALQERPLSTNLFVEVVNTIKRNDQGIRKLSGTQIQNPRREPIYTPPEGEERIRNLLRNLEEFIHAEDDLDPLVKMAVIHYPFEAIHPFGDGNGRTGRIINVLYLISEKLLNRPILYLSGYIIERKTEYYRGLRGVTEEGAWEDWILYMLLGLEETALATRDKVLAIKKLLDDAVTLAREKAPKIYSKELIELIFQQPYCRIQFVEQAGIASRNTASKYLRELESIGLLRSVKAGRERLYVNDPLYSLLTK